MADAARTELDSGQKLTYLTNIARMASADGSIAVQEEALIEEIRQNIGATKTQLRQALMACSNGRIELESLPRLSWRIRNIEDMLELAMSDNDMSDAEKRLLSEAVGSAGLTQSLVSVLVAESRNRRQSAIPRCPTCGNDAARGAKYCPTCGADLRDPSVMVSTRLELAIPASGYTIAFADSSAAGFPSALAVARMQSSFQQASRLGKTWYAVTFDRAGHDDLIELVEGLKGMRNREAYVAGELKPWDAVFGWTWCFKQRSGAYYPARWCFGLEDGSFNPWGCRMLQMDLNTWGTDWLCYGKFVDKTTFVFDKDRIRFELDQGINRVQLCPCVHQKLIAAVLQRLPDRVVVGRGTWDYQETYQPDPEAFKVVRTHRIGGYTETEEFYTKGVCLKDNRWALTLLASAMKDVGVVDIDLRKLTSA